MNVDVQYNMCGLLLSYTQPRSLAHTACGRRYVLEQLDQDGDGEITWQEFEAILAERM